MAAKVLKRALAGIVVLFATGTPSHAEVAFEWVTVGRPGNLPDPLNSGAVPGIGAVPYVYRIAKYEVTNAQYVEFLNAVATTDTNSLYHVWMASDSLRGGIERTGSPGTYVYATKPNMGDKPVNLVTYINAMRFANWLHNGQPTGAQDVTTTEDGAYSIADGFAEVRKPMARFFIPSENEWYKAAYHQPQADGGDVDDFWLYSTRSNSIPTIAQADAVGNISNPGANVANYQFGAVWNGQGGHVTTVGSAGSLSDSYYGTADQAGNLHEWNEALLLSGSCRGARGGAWAYAGTALSSSVQGCEHPSSFSSALMRVGFRIATVAENAGVPAVSTWGLLVLLFGLLVAATCLLRRVKMRESTVTSWTDGFALWSR